MFMLMFLITGMQAQNIVKGLVSDGDSENPLQNVLVSVKSTTVNQTTGADGIFVLKNLSNGNYIVEIKLSGYETQNFPLELTGKGVDLGTILLYQDISEDQAKETYIELVNNYFLYRK